MSGTVVFVERHINHFRVPFYEGLRNALARDGVRVRVLTGESTPAEIAKGDRATLPWAEKIQTRFFFGDRICWAPIRAGLGRGDLLVVEQANRNIYNLWELHRPRTHAVAFWGHGRNMQSDRPDGFKERFKRRIAVKPDWWFAYTEGTRRFLTGLGYPADRVTVFNNAIDTTGMLRDLAGLTPEEIARRRREIGLKDGPVGLFLGSLYGDKGLDFCMNAALRVRSRVPGFQWLIIGDGPDCEHFAPMAREHGWVHRAGARTGRDKVLDAQLAGVLMIPGAIGLVALDSLVLGLPIVTVRGNKHGPEVEYLDEGVDFLATEPLVDRYVEAVSGLLLDRSRLAAMQSHCRGRSGMYSIEAMVERVRQGVLQAMRLGHGPVGRPVPRAAGTGAPE